MATKAKTSQTARILKAKRAIDRERELIQMTVGQTVGLLMNPGTKASPDLALIYQNLGGKSEFTKELLARAFGSRSMRRKGEYTLEPGVAPDFVKLQTTLVATGKTLAEKGLGGVGGLAPTIIEAPTGKAHGGTVWTLTIPSAGGGDKRQEALRAVLSVNMSCNGGGGGSSGW